MSHGATEPSCQCPVNHEADPETHTPDPGMLPASWEGVLPERMTQQSATAESW